MFAPIRVWQFAGALVALTLACDSKEPSMSKAAEQAEKKDAEEKKAKEEADKKLAEQAKAAKAGKVENPWKFEAVKTTLIPGTVLDYEMTGTDIKGKPVEDRLHASVVSHTDADIKILEYKKSVSGNPAVTQPQGHPWASVSPFFWVEQSEIEYVRREQVNVPAGAYDCVVADIKGYFGKHVTVWMIVDQPGIYAQVVEHPNSKSAEEGDPTEITYKLASIAHKN